MRAWLLAVLCIGCGSETSPYEPASGDPVPREEAFPADSLAGTFEGYYSAGFEHTGFRPCAAPAEAWWTEAAVTLHWIADDQARVATAPAADLPAHYREVVGDAEGVYGEGVAVWARLRGRATARGPNGHLDVYTRTFTVDSVEAMRAEAPSNACPQPAHIRP